MSEANFSLTRYRFQHLEAHGLDYNVQEPLDLELKFEISFDDEAPGEDHFTVIIKLALSTRGSESVSPIISVSATGCYSFNPGVEPYRLQDVLQRVYAANLLYGCMRPIIDSLTNSVGLHGMNMPLTLPLGNEGPQPADYQPPGATPPETTS